MKHQYVLTSHNTKLQVCRRIMEASLGKVVIIKNPTRSLEQNAKLHAMLTDISRQAQYLGKKHDTDFWKALFVSAHAIATHKPYEIVPGLEGEFLMIRESTATMSCRRLSSVMEYIHAWAAHNDIKFTAAEWELDE